MSSLISDVTSAISSLLSTTTTTPPPPATTTTTNPPPATTTTTTPSAPTTSSVPPSTSITSLPPTSTTYVPPPSTVIPSTSIIAITSTVTQSPSNGGTQGPAVITITSTQAVVTTPGVTTSSSRSSSSSSSASATPSVLSASGNSVASKGLSNGATIAIAVIIPIVAVAGLILFGIFFWRRRRNRKNAEEQRKNEMAEYGFNPNNDPTLPIGAAAYTDGGSEGNDDSGYRGWGATTVSGRKTSTNLGSNSRGPAMAGVTGAMSDGGSQAGGFSQPSPSAGAASDGTQEPLVQAHHDPTIPTAAAAGVAGGAVTGATLAALNSNSARNQRFSNSIHRGPSNASSAYSAGGALSEVSSEHNPMPGPYTYQEEVPYNVYNEGQNPYGDSGHHAEIPVIRDVQARRNTRIERAPTFPQQGGIAQNF